MATRGQRTLDRIKTEIIDMKSEGMAMGNSYPLLECRIPKNLCLSYSWHPSPPGMAYSNEPVLEWCVDKDDLLPESDVYEVKRRDWGGCLDEFVRLHEAPDTSYLSFARRWGVLGVCTSMFTKIGQDGFVIYREPLKEWRRFAADYRAIMLLTAALLRNERTRPEDWKTVVRFHSGDVADLEGNWSRLELDTNKHPSFIELMNDSQLQKDVLMTIVMQIERNLGAKSLLVWKGETRQRTLDVNSWSHQFEPSPLNKVIALQLCNAVISTKGVYLCDFCDRPFDLPLGTQRPHKGRRACCGSEDCKLAQNRDAQTRRRDRIRRAKTQLLFEEGGSPP